jgi:hypothetical protein
MNVKRGAAFAISIFCFAATATLWRLHPTAFPHAWLTALFAWLGIPLGCMALIFIHALSGGAWGDALRPHLVAGVRSLFLLPLFLVPFLLTVTRLYPWLAINTFTLPNAFYLNGGFAAARLAVYLVVWFTLCRFSLSGLNDDTSLSAIAPGALIALVLTATFMSVDAVMSLDPSFASSIFGLLRMAEMGLFALSAAILAVWGGGFAADALRQLGRFLLALVILWAYLDFMQLLIVWQSNLPNEAAWYGRRLSGGWGVLAASIALTHFALPFFALLSPRAQASRAVMACIAVLLMVAACARSFWLIGPEAPADPLIVALTLAVAVAGMLAASAGFAISAPVSKREFVRHERENA